MKKTLPLLGLFLLVFIGTVLLLGGGLDLTFLGGTTDADTFQESLRPGATGNRGADGTSENGSADAPKEAGADPSGPPTAPGRIEGRAVDASGAPVALVSLNIVPGAGRVTRHEGEDWRIESVPPGEYQLTIWADGYLPARLTVEVRPGQRTWRSVTLGRGILPEGTIVDETDQRGVANALIEFGGGCRTRSDAAGRFRAPYTIAPSALDLITVSHPEYDRYTYVRQPTLDPSNIRLALSRGDAHVTGRLLPSSETFQVEQARVRLFFTTGGRHDLRRQLLVPIGQTFRIPRVHEGLYDLAVDFPGTRLPEIHRELMIRSKQRKHLDIEVGGGTAVSGRLLARAGGLAGRRVELINERGLAIAGVNSDRDGAFELLSVPRGTYRVKVWYGNPWFNTQPFSVSGTGRSKIVVDCDSHRLR